jgi:hypothetical protein
MKIKKKILPGSFRFVLGLLLLLVQGCTTTSAPWHYYLQRSPVRVVVLPSGNKTAHPDAPVIFNKACQEALTKKGFVVITADQVVTYASSRGLLLKDVTDMKAGEIGKDLKADLVLYSNIDNWGSTFAVLNTQVRVSGISRLIETSTEALVWQHNWDLVQDSGNGNNNGIVGLLVSAAVSAVANSAFDACSSLGTQAGTITVNSMPCPGFAPACSKPRRTT